jgi:tRNA dimethylallyltransferase
MALSLAEALNTEIVSFDARQIYRELNIGVARPSVAELQRVKHYFIASHTIHQPISAAQYAAEASVVIKNILSKRQWVILVGGSGFYLKALLFPLDPIPEATAEARRKARSMTLPELRAFVESKDPIYFKQVDRQNPVRLARAAEVILTTGRPFSSYLKCSSVRNPRWAFVAVQPAINDAALRRSIHQRTLAMWEQGLADECRVLLPWRQLQPLRSVGYVETFDFLEGLYDEGETLRRIEKHTWQYARRQKTWFRHQLPQSPLPLTEQELSEFVQKLKEGRL